MKRFSLGLISLLILIGLNGCATYDVLKLGTIDRNDKSILIPSSGVLSMIEIKKMLLNNGWKFTASTSSRNTSGTTFNNNINFNTVNLTKSRYRMYITETNRMNQFVLTIHISIIDNTTQEEVLSLFGDSTGAGGVFPSSTAKKLEQALKEIETTSNNVKNNNKQIDKIISLKTINMEDTTKKGLKVYLKSNDSILNGKYKVLLKQSPEIYSIVTFAHGLVKSEKMYTLNHELQMEGIFDNGVKVKEKRFNKNQSLFAIINIKDGKNNGLAKYFYPTGELNYEINYKAGLAISGYKYQLTGTKSKMTEAHFYNLKIPYNN